MMDRYLAQCADEAFKALLTDEDLETRLNTAAMHLGIPNDSQVDTASQDVRSALADVRSNRNDPCPNRASAIEQILREFAVERSRSEVAIAADFPKAVKQEKELKDKTVKKILVSDTDAAIKNANLFFAQGDDVVADKVQVIESMVPGYKVGRDAENSVTPESLARGIQALNTFLKK
jgi:hypothetical protein